MVLCVPSNFQEALVELDKLVETYDVSIGIKRYLEDRDIHSEDPYYDYKDKSWEIMVSSGGYLVLHPYEHRCEVYSAESRNLRK